MHAEAAQFVAFGVPWTQATEGSVIEFGGLNVNGSIRGGVPHKSWHCVDIKDGPDVDEVADAVTWRGFGYGSYDVGICLEVFEHAPQWPAIATNLIGAVQPGGMVVVTCASDGREVHGAYGDRGLPSGEWYENVGPIKLAQVMTIHLREWELSYIPHGDVRLWGIKK